MAIGSWGKSVVFETSDKKILTPSSFEYSSTARWNSHEIIGQSPKGEFIGPGSGKVVIDIILDATLGVKPASVIKTLRKARDNGTVEYLKIGKAKIGNYKWAITDMSEKWDVVYDGGELARATLNITFSEYR